MNRGGWAGQIIDLVYLNKDGLGKIVANQFKIGVAKQMADILFAAGEKVVQAEDIMPFGD